MLHYLPLREEWYLLVLVYRRHCNVALSTIERGMVYLGTFYRRHSNAALSTIERRVLYIGAVQLCGLCEFTNILPCCKLHTFQG